MGSFWHFGRRVTVRGRGLRITAALTTSLGVVRPRPPPRSGCGLKRGFVQRAVRGCVGSVAINPDGKTLASAIMGSPDADPDNKTIKLWDVTTGKERAILQGHEGMVYSVAFSPDGKTLASVSDDQTVKLWDLATNKERATLQGHTQAVMSVAFSPDGRTLTSASNDKTVKLWDVATDN